MGSVLCVREGALLPEGALPPEGALLPEGTLPPNSGVLLWCDDVDSASEPGGPAGSDGPDEPGGGTMLVVLQ